MKTLETPEEKRARRLAKKEAKERRRKEKMGWDKDYLVNNIQGLNFTIFRIEKLPNCMYYNIMLHVCYDFD